MPQLTPNTPSAKATLNSLRTELTHKGLKPALGSLPHSSAILISPQHFSASEHPFKLHLGSETGSRVWATLGRRPRNPNQAPYLLFFAGSSDLSMVQLPSFHSLEKVHLVEPFRTFWDKSRDMVGSQGQEDERRGQFKGLVYWYFFGDAVGRDGGFRVPKPVGGYVERALERLGRVGGGMRDGMEDIAEVWGEVERLKEGQREIEMCGVEGDTEGLKSSAKTSQKPWHEDTGQKGFRDSRGEVGNTDEVMRLSPPLGRSAGSHDTAHKASPYNRTIPENPVRGTKRKRPPIEEGIESEVQSTNDQSSAWERTEKEEYAKTTRSRGHVISTPTSDFTSDFADYFEDHGRGTESFQAPRSKERPDRHRTFQDTRRSMIRLKTEPLPWGEDIGWNTALLASDNTTSSKSPETTTVFKPDTPPADKPLVSSATDLDLTSAQYIDSMKKALLKTEQLEVDLASIEQEERKLIKEKEILDERRKRAREALQDNHAAIQYISAGIVRGTRIEKAS
ncbi:hypothetical protein HBH50_173640 [Parastagonospora nodorum]|nr:hypothetical protein HBH50_173640 [Parastagonospora nodorum]KAH4083821.1 hypothetical protein HBH48_171240 [Parastagonospora nodorum]